MKKNQIRYVLLVLILFLILAACKISFTDEETPEIPTDTPIPPATLQPTTEPTLQPTLEPTQEPTLAPTESNIPDGWLTYTNLVYGFEISYPGSFQALDDADNLYGWPNGMVLLYNGGQSYDIVIQAWDSSDQITNNYPSAGEFITVVPAGNKFISIFNITRETDNPAIIATFQLLN